MVRMPFCVKGVACTIETHVCLLTDVFVNGLSLGPGTVAQIVSESKSRFKRRKGQRKKSGADENDNSGDGNEGNICFHRSRSFNRIITVAVLHYSGSCCVRFIFIRRHDCIAVRRRWSSMRTSFQSRSFATGSAHYGPSVRCQVWTASLSPVGS